PHRPITSGTRTARPGRATVGARLRRTGGGPKAGSRRDGDIAARAADRLVGAVDAGATTTVARATRPRDHRRRKGDDEDRDREERHPSFHALDPFEVPGELQDHLSMYSLFTESQQHPQHRMTLAVSSRSPPGPGTLLHPAIAR